MSLESTMIVQHPAEQGVELSLVIPLYNEEDGLRKMALDMLAEFRRSAVRCELVLVNNGSRDGTGDILKQLAQEFREIRVVHVPVNLGYGWGIICGLRAATGPILGFMCGDGQIMPEDVVRVHRQLVEHNLDLCKVVRVVRTDGLQRKVMSLVYNILFRGLFGLRSQDINGTPKLMRHGCYEALSLMSKDWFIDAEAMIKASRRGYRIGEVPVEFHPRENGHSHVKLTTALEFLKNMVRYRISGWKEDIHGEATESGHPLRRDGYAPQRGNGIQAQADGGDRRTSNPLAHHEELRPLRLP